MPAAEFSSKELYFTSSKKWRWMYYRYEMLSCLWLDLLICAKKCSSFLFWERYNNILQKVQIKIGTPSGLGQPLCKGNLLFFIFFFFCCCQAQATVHILFLPTEKIYEENRMSLPVLDSFSVWGGGGGMLLRKITNNRSLSPTWSLTTVLQCRFSYKQLSKVGNASHVESTPLTLFVIHRKQKSTHGGL